VPERWTAVDDYLDAHVLGGRTGPQDASVAPNQAALLGLLVKISGAQRVLEIGTLQGYSTEWLARDADEVVTIESDPANAELARANLERAGVADWVEVRVGAALDVLPELHGPFDLVFIDADKEHHAEYLDWAIRLGRSGTVIVADNVVREGAVLDASSDDPRVQGVRRFFDALDGHPELDATALQTVGRKGWDGFVLAVVR
jgi:predicted O-methyltransferase YrrM